MAQKGINKNSIMKKAIKMIEQSGNPTISMHELAENLNIKTPSLYNHIKNRDALLLEISKYTAEELKKAQFTAMEGKQKEEAIYALATAYRDFAKKHIGLYHVMMSSPKIQKNTLEQSAAPMIEPILFILSEYSFDTEQSIHWQRILRSIMHGFLTQEEAGFFGNSDVDVQISYKIAIRCFLNGIHAEIEEIKHDRK